MRTGATKRRLQAVVGFAIIIGVISVALGFYQHAFSRTVDVIFAAPSAGVLLVPGSEVRLRGVPVGRVDGITTRGHESRLHLALDPAKTRFIPADATGTVTPSTVVSGPHVELLTTASSGARPIRAGDVIRADRQIPSVNDLFQKTIRLLQAVPVDDLNATLSGLAGALDGRGDQLGALLTQLDDYVIDLNRHDTALTRDLALTADVSNQYERIAPPLIRLLKHSTVTAHTIYVRRDDFSDLLEAGDDLGETGRPLMDNLRKPLTSALRQLDPPAALLAKYSPMFPCTLQEMARQAENNVSLGVRYPGAQAIMTLLPGQRGYRYPTDLPKFVNDRGPMCYSLPHPPSGVGVPYRRFNDNAHANEGDGGVSLQPIQFFPPSSSAEGSETTP